MNDIEVLEDINFINEILKEKLSADEYGKVVTRVSIIKADLKERQSDKERIKELEESEKYIYEAYQDAGKKMFEYAEELENSIPKSLIKEKIEELKDIKLCGGNINQAIIEDKIQVLEELLNKNVK